MEFASNKVLSEMQRLQIENPAEFEKLNQLMQKIVSSESKQRSNDAIPGQDKTIDDLSSILAGLSDEEKNSLKSLRLPQNGSVLTESGIEKQTDGEEIKPNPSFCIKTLIKNTNQKVFINLCEHESINKPGPKKKLDETGKEIEGINIPLSAGPSREGNDHSGSVCILFDVIVNPIVIQEINADSTGGYRDFVIQLVIHHLSQKNKLDIDTRYKLPRLAYKSSLEDEKSNNSTNLAPSQIISKRPSIEEISSENDVNTSVKPKVEVAVTPVEVALKSMEWKLSNSETVQISDSNIFFPSIELINSSLALNSAVSVECLIIQFTCNDHLPELKASEYIIQLGNLNLKLPCVIKPHQLEARHNLSTGVISVTVPIDSSDVSKSCDVGSRQYLLRNALAEEEDDDKKTRSKRSVYDRFGLSSAPSSLASSSSLVHLPEDDFHKKDPMSMHLLQLRAGDDDNKKKKKKNDVSEARGEEWDDLLT